MIFRVAKLYSVKHITELSVKNYYDFLTKAEHDGCNEAVRRIVPRIDIQQIFDFVENVPYISELQREFYKKYISARYELIMLPALEIVQAE